MLYTDCIHNYHIYNIIIVVYYDIIIIYILRDSNIKYYGVYSPVTAKEHHRC